MFISLSDIHVDSRIREDYGSESEWKEFVESFPKLGQLQAIKVEPLGPDKFRLISGGRRFRAISELTASGIAVPGVPLGMIEATVGDEAPARVRLIREFNENEKRKEFTFVEKAKFIRTFHEQMVAEVGPRWTQVETAWSLSLSQPSISLYLKVEEAVKTDENVAKASTLQAAIKRIKINDNLRARHEAVKTGASDSFARATQILHHGDAREWITTLDDGSVDFINFDPPWGDNASHKSAENHEEFDDSTEYADVLMRALFPQLFRVLKDNRFCVFWHRMWASERMAALAQEFGFNLTHTRTPCIWYKPDKITDQNRDPEKRLIEAYEPFYLLRKGDPIFHEKFENNVFPFPRVPLGSVIHPTEKPIALCDAILRLCTVPGESILDPTAGSSAMLTAALKANRKAKGCELSKTYYDRGITRLAEYLKTFSQAYVAGYQRKG